MNNPLSYIMIKKNTMHQDGIDALVECADKEFESKELGVFDQEKSVVGGESIFCVNKDVRDVKGVNFKEFDNDIDKWVRHLFLNVVNPFYGFNVEQYSWPSLLKYEIGGHYKEHIDADQEVKVGTGEIVYKKVSERDLSLILFLNDDYEGGDLVFVDQNIKIKPEPGLLVTFPSTYNYPHKVEPVTKGTRYAMVWWATILGFPTVKDEDEEFKRKYG